MEEPIIALARAVERQPKKEIHWLRTACPERKKVATTARLKVCQPTVGSRCVRGEEDFEGVREERILFKRAM
jgi:hypothetical protein